MLTNINNLSRREGQSVARNMKYTIKKSDYLESQPTSN